MNAAASDHAERARELLAGIESDLLNANRLDRNAKPRELGRIYGHSSSYTIPLAQAHALLALALQAGEPRD